MDAIGIGPTLALRPGDARGVSFDFSGTVLPAGVTVSRSSAASYFDTGGTVAIAPADTARLDHDPATLATRGLLIEPPATNAFQRSEALDNSFWTIGAGLTRSANVASSPASASTTAERLTKDAANSAGYLRREGVFAAATYTLSAFVKPETARYLGIRIAASGGLAGCAVFDAQGGGFTSLPTGYNAGVQPLQGGWFRIWASRDYPPAEASGAGQFGIALTDASGTEIWSPPAAVSALVTGMQLETGTVPTAYIVTTSTAGTRAAESAMLDWGGRGVPDGAIMVRYGFDDGSTQDVATSVSAGKAALPTILNRRWIVRAALL